MSRYRLFFYLPNVKDILCFHIQHYYPHFHYFDLFRTLYQLKVKSAYISIYKYVIDILKKETLMNIWEAQRKKGPCVFGSMSCQKRAWPVTGQSPFVTPLTLLQYFEV